MRHTPMRCGPDGHCSNRSLLSAMFFGAQPYPFSRSGSTYIEPPVHALAIFVSKLMIQSAILVVELSNLIILDYKSHE